MRATSSCLLALLGLAAPALAAEPSPPLALEVSPGLSPEVVRQHLEGQRAQVAGCARLVERVQGAQGVSFRPMTAELASADDRASVTFRIRRDGKVVEDSARVRGVFLEPHCLGKLVRSWRFPAFPAEEEVEVEWTFRFRTSAAERKAALQARHAELDAFCATFESLAKAKVPSRDRLAEAVRRFRAAHPSPLPDTQAVLEPAPFLNAEEAGPVLQSSAEEVGYPRFCPALAEWSRRMAP